MIGIGGDDDKTALKGAKDQMTSYEIKQRRKKWDVISRDQMTS